MKKKVLGRGLSALMGETESEGRGRYMLCPVERIVPNRRQPRKAFDSGALDELADSIREKGVIEPLVVRRAPEGFELIAGERRWRAATKVGLKEVPVVVVEASDEESLELAIIENIQREDLNPIEEAEAYQSLVGFGLSQDAVARKVGKDRATVANYLRLLKLPPEVKEELVNNTITMGHARAILSVEGHAAQRELCRKVIEKGLSVRETERLASNRSKPDPPARKRAAHLVAIEEELRRRFGTKVNVKEGGRGKGRIEIEFYSPQERERLIDILRSV